ncbi:MAG: DUF932 domain-containing protein, partial [Phycisphaerales bacterium]|nr:DUF932 domain-containing protein [Phycisphaerales bacterium]
MSHEIDTSTGQAAVFVTGTPAWHRLGRTIEQAATSADAINLAGLNWHVAQWPINATDPTSWLTTSAPDHVANVRTDTRSILGIVSKDYRVFQNADAFDFMDSLVGDKLAMFETAGSLKGGRKVWMLARIPKEYRAGPDDLIKPYVLLVNSHDGTSSLRMLPTTVRVVCQNTLNLALREAGTEGIPSNGSSNVRSPIRSFPCVSLNTVNSSCRGSRGHVSHSTGSKVAPFFSRSISTPSVVMKLTTTRVISVSCGGIGSACTGTVSACALSRGSCGFFRDFFAGWAGDFRAFRELCLDLRDMFVPLQIKNLRDYVSHVVDVLLMDHPPASRLPTELFVDGACSF